jgi:tRNA(Arg) A34 adenosine deaminase TadA
MNAKHTVNPRHFSSARTAFAGEPSARRLSSLPPQNSESAPPPDIHPGDPLARYWQETVSRLVEVQLPAELSNDVVRERHCIFSLLLMALIFRFWNGNNNGPRGMYPQRERQKETGQEPKADSFSYTGDYFVSNDPQRVSWDRYIGHNIACLAVDGKGEVMDFDFNHNDVFRSSAEHAESRLVRRIFSLADLIDAWKPGKPIRGKSPAFTLKDVTIYTSLESCAQCSGVMSLGRVKQVVYLQNDPGAYRIGNIMYNLAGREDPKKGDGSALAAIPIPASDIGLPYFLELNAGFDKFRSEMLQAEALNDSKRAFFVPPSSQLVPNPAPIYTQSITSFLCTDAALDIFEAGAAEFDKMQLKHPAAKSANLPEVWSNKQCLEEAKKFFSYASILGFRGSPHKL